MMNKNYQYDKQFLKQFKKLSRKKQLKVREALDLYLVAPNTPSLRVHQLSGNLSGITSISAGGDLRVHLLMEKNEIIIVVLEVGSHAQLY